MHKNTKTYCDGCNVTHTSIMCFNKPRRHIKSQSDKTITKYQAFNRMWYEINPPSAKGTWDCYLRISTACERKVTRSTINLEHAYSKVRHPEWKYCLWNVYPACQPCNRLKGSKDISDFGQANLIILTDKLSKLSGIKSVNRSDNNTKTNA